MPERGEFRLPEAVVRKKFLFFALAVPLTLVLTSYLGVQASLYSRLSTAGLFGVLLLACYFVARRRIWVTATPDGLLGHGPTWRKIEVGWNESIEVKAASVSTMRGLLVCRSADAGVLRKSMRSLFIPADILVMADFQAVVRRHAAPSHRLRAFIDLAT